MPDEVKNALMARELQGKDDDETERLRRKYVRDMIDAKNAEGGYTRDVNLPKDPQRIKDIETSRAETQAYRDRKAKKAQEREDFNREYLERADAGLPPEPYRQDINLSLRDSGMTYKEELRRRREGGKSR